MAQCGGARISLVGVARKIPRMSSRQRENEKMNALEIPSDPAPLVTGEDGVVRVGRTRVRLDTIVRAVNQGATAEEILQQYPSVTLPDIYATISYYRQHQNSVDAYLREHGLVHNETLRHNGPRFDSAGVRERLLECS